MTHVFLIEDNPTLREIMIMSFDLLDDVNLCGDAGSAEEALEKLGTLEPDLILVDGSLPGMCGTDFVRTIKQLRPELRCLFLSGRNEAEVVREALRAGACGYVVKGGRPTELLDAITLSMNDGRYISSSVAGWE